MLSHPLRPLGVVVNVGAPSLVYIDLMIYNVRPHRDHAVGLYALDATTWNSMAGYFILSCSPAKLDQLPDQGPQSTLHIAVYDCHSQGAYIHPAVYWQDEDSWLSHVTFVALCIRDFPDAVWKWTSS